MRKSFTLLFCVAVLMSCGDDSSSSPNVMDSQSSSEAFSLSSSAIAHLSSTIVSLSSSATDPQSSASLSSSAVNSLDGSASVLPTSSATASSEGSSATSESSSCAAGTSDGFSNAVLPSSSSNGSDAWYFDETDGKCDGVCNNFTAKDPVLTDRGGEGSITTYGSVTEKETSLGGACNYGQTNIQYYAAIHVNVSSGDDKGPWNGGLACGGCVRVKARTPDGWKRVTVRITDRCPDESCGVDLGGAPAYDIMGDGVGRYYGEWEFVSCEGVNGVWGDSTSIWVKEGASTFWSIIQVRNPKDAVTRISVSCPDAGNATADNLCNEIGVAAADLKFAIEAENFWTVPQAALQTKNEIQLMVNYRTGAPDTLKLQGADLAVGEANYYL